MRFESWSRKCKRMHIEEDLSRPLGKALALACSGTSLARDLGAYRPESIGGSWMPVVSIDRGDSNGSNPGLESEIRPVGPEILDIKIIHDPSFIHYSDLQWKHVQYNNRRIHISHYMWLRSKIIICHAGMF